MEKVIKVPVESIQMPSKKDYVRHGIEEKHIASLRMFLPTKDAKPSDWVFPPVILFKLKDPGTKVKYGVVDGVHRVQVALDAELTDIPAILESPENHFENLLAQLVYNLRHGLPITKEDRNETIKRLRGAGYTLEQLSKSTGLHVSQISRISTGAKNKPKKSTGSEKTTEKVKEEGESPILKVTCPGCGNIFDWTLTA
jgi:hypothetical protein